jgi:hypothetical protein
MYKAAISGNNSKGLKSVSSPRHTNDLEAKLFSIKKRAKIVARLSNSSPFRGCGPVAEFASLCMSPQD